MFLSRFVPCARCGASIDRTVTDPHVCDPERRAAYQFSVLRPLVDDFESQLHDYLAGQDGRLESWLAFRKVRGHPGLDSPEDAA